MSPYPTVHSKQPTANRCNCAGLTDASAICAGRTIEMIPEQSRCFLIGASNALERAALSRRSRLLSVILNNRRALLPSVPKVIQKLARTLRQSEGMACLSSATIVLKVTV